MRNEDVYFEDIFFPVKILWKGQYELVFGNKSKSYIKALGNDFDLVEHIVDVGNKKNYNEWHSMMVLVMYQVLTETGLRLLEQGIYSLDIDNIPIKEFEEKYLENLKFEGNEKYLVNYKGLN